MSKIFDSCAWALVLSLLDSIGLPKRVPQGLRGQWSAHQCWTYGSAIAKEPLFALAALLKGNPFIPLGTRLYAPPSGEEKKAGDRAPFVVRPAAGWRLDSGPESWMPTHQPHWTRYMDCGCQLQDQKDLPRNEVGGKAPNFCAETQIPDKSGDLDVIRNSKKLVLHVYVDGLILSGPGVGLIATSTCAAMFIETENSQTLLGHVLEIEAPILETGIFSSIATYATHASLKFASDWLNQEFQQSTGGQTADE